jgi:hypothetical protein
MSMINQRINFFETGLSIYGINFEDVGLIFN